MAKKRANGEGTVRQLPSGKWQAQYMDGWKPDGRKNVKTWTRDTQRKALKAMQDYIKDKENGLLTGKEIAFADWAEECLENRKDNIGTATYENYRYMLKHLKAYFGRKKLADIKTKDVEMFLTKLRLDGLSDSLQSKCKSMLSQIFDKAIANDILIKNPAKYAEKIKKGPQKEKEAFTVDEFSLLMANLPENWIGWSIRLMLCTGMRTQELLALEPRFIAEDGSYIEIRQAVKREKGTAVIGPPKSRDSERIVLVPEKVQYCARLLRDTTDRFIWESPKKPGMPCNPSHFRDQFKKTLEAIEGVRVLTPHCCRHTYVSQMQMLGVDLATIQSIVGHADVDMTKHYLHVQDPVRLAAIEKFSNAFSEHPKASHLNVLDFLESS
mgnify:CR=1 FL=1